MSGARGGTPKKLGDAIDGSRFHRPDEAESEKLAEEWREQRRKEEDRRRANAQEDHEQWLKHRKLEIGEERLSALWIPEAYEHATFETLECFGKPKEQEVQQKSMNMAHRWVENWRECSDAVILGRAEPKCGGATPLLQVWSGSTGTAKTHLLHAIARVLATDFLVRCRVKKLGDLVREIRSSWGGRGGQSEEQVLKFYRGLGWLAIDEVSRHAYKGDAQQPIYDVIDDRLQNQRPTILVTNEGPRELASMLGQALMSRINGAGGVVQFGMADYRVQHNTVQRKVG